MRYRIKPNRAFTLIELLTVIAIIGVLVALLFPAVKSAMLKAETSKAQAAISSGLATAFKSYYTEYGKWPVAYPGVPAVPPEDFVVDEKMVALLSGDDVGGTSIRFPGPLTYPAKVDISFGPPYTPSTAIYQGNPRKIIFLEFKTKDLDTSAGPTQGYFIDPWGRPYHYRFDVTYANQVLYPFVAALPPTMNTGFLIWSVGPDGQYDEGDVVVTGPPLPLTVTSSQKNKDNVKNW